MALREKVYGFCKNFCKVEVPAKEDVYLKEEVGAEFITFVSIGIDTNGGSIDTTIILPEKFQDIEMSFIYVGQIYGFSHREGVGFSGYNVQSNTLRSTLETHPVNNKHVIRIRGDISYFGAVNLTIPVAVLKRF